MSSYNETTTIGLNIGGKKYYTTYSTLTRFKDSLLSKMFVYHGHMKKDAQGNFFFDRDGVIFRHILNYLRTGKLTLPGNFDEFDLLIQEANFYGLSQLKEAVHTKIKSKETLAVKMKGLMLEEQQPDTDDIQYLKLIYSNETCLYTLYGMHSVLMSIPEIATMCPSGQSTSNSGDEIYVQFGGCSWSRIVKLLTVNGFECKSVACGCGGNPALFKESEIWLFERKNA